MITCSISRINIVPLFYRF